MTMDADGDSYKAKVAGAIAALIEKPLWACGRIAGMAMFHFGTRLKVPSRHGGAREVGEYALHVQCGWRITRGNRVIVGSRDLYCPADFDEKRDEISDDFDWDNAPSRREKQLAWLFEKGTREFIVQKVEVGNAGSLTLHLSDALVLEVFPDHSLGSEHWRLFRVGQEKKQPPFVVAGSGIET